MKYLCSTYNKIIANAIANEIKKRIVTSMTRLSIRICTSHELFVAVKSSDAHAPSRGVDKDGY